jgi:hypothetical protein
MATAAAKHVTKFAAELATGLFTLALGLAIAVGAAQYGVGWNEAGPEPGTFPFWVGALVAAASVGNVVQATRRRHAQGTFLDAQQARRIAAFGIPLILFVAASITLGFYVATVVYLCAVMHFQGGYRWITSVAVSVGSAVFFFVMLEIWFKVPLLKGPLESALGIH